MNKKGIELSINFLVIIILSLIIFSFGVRFIYQLGSEATELQRMTIEQLDEKIGNLACEGSDRVCFPTDAKNIKKDKSDIFGFKIINILDSQNFDINVSKSSPYGYTKEGSPITADYLKIKPEFRSEYIEKNEEKSMGMMVLVLKNAKSGTYVLDVAVCYNDLEPSNDDATGKCANDLYSFNKLYVAVP